MKTLRELLTEAPASKCEKIFQKEIFGWLTGEKDTNKEDSMRWLIMAGYFEDNEIDPDIVKAFRNLKACQKKYPKALDAKNGQQVYRGLSSSKLLDDVLKNSDFTMEWKDYYVKTHVYKPHREIQSFTTSWKTAQKFTYADMLHYGDATGSHTGLIFVTKTDDSFIFTEKFTNWIDKESALDNEHEITRVSKKPIKGKLYVKKSIYNKFKKQIKRTR